MPGIPVVLLLLTDDGTAAPDDPRLRHIFLKSTEATLVQALRETKQRCLPAALSADGDNSRCNQQC